jgi:hypothetical protein
MAARGESTYRHTQIGWLVIGVEIAALAVLVPMVLWSASAWVALFVVGVLALVVSIAGSLTVVVDRERITAKLGLGLFRRRIPLADVQSFRKVRNPWYFGWGVRLIPGGWMYNVSGLSAVELVLRSGRRFRIGTDQPDALFDALRQRLGEPGEPVPDPTRGRAYLLAMVVGISAGVLILIAVGILLLVESRPPRITVAPGSLEVESALYDDEVADGALEAVALLDQLPPIRSRTNGFALGGLLRGSFALQDGRKARLYVDAGAPPFVEVRHAGGVLIFNAEQADETRALYESLRERAAEQ